MGIIKSYQRISKLEIEKLSSIKSEEELNEILEKGKEYFDIGKSWEALHFLITGEKEFSEHPFTKIIYPNNYTIQFSEKEEALLNEYFLNNIEEESEEIQALILKQDLSQGFVDSEVIIEIISELDKINFEQILDKADFETFNEIGIYPEIWSSSDDNKTYFQTHFNNLFSFLQRAKKEKDYIIVF